MTSQALLTHSLGSADIHAPSGRRNPPHSLPARPSRNERTTLPRTNCPHGVTEVEQLYQKDLAVGSGQVSDRVQLFVLKLLCWIFGDICTVCTFIFMPFICCTFILFCFVPLLNIFNAIWIRCSFRRRLRSVQS